MARKTLKSAEAKNDELMGKLAASASDVAALRQQIRELITEKDQLGKKLEESRSHFADLKERLHDAEVALARANGYIDRVVDNDAGDDPVVDPGRNEGFTRGGRGPQIHRRVNSRDEVAHANSYGRAVPRMHWTNY